jgi:hypothetical protein
VVLLLALAFVAGVVSIVVVVFEGGVELLPLGAVDNEVGGVAALEAAPSVIRPLLEELVQGTELSHRQVDLIIEDALVLFTRHTSKYLSNYTPSTCQEL